MLSFHGFQIHQDGEKNLRRVVVSAHLADDTHLLRPLDALAVLHEERAGRVPVEAKELLARGERQLLHICRNVLQAKGSYLPGLGRRPAPAKPRSDDVH